MGQVGVLLSCFPFNNAMCQINYSNDITELILTEMSDFAGFWFDR